MRRFALILIASFLLVIPTLAQDGYPLPHDLPPITPENAAQLTELASILHIRRGGDVQVWGIPPASWMNR